MELGKIKQNVFQWIGWLSVVTGLISLAILNIFLLWEYDIPIVSNIFNWILITFILGVISIFNKNSRSLGLWGIWIGIYMGFFVAVMFVLSWTISPFP
jgi:hypothetical protein